jgi:hypothetical protein
MRFRLIALFLAIQAVSFAIWNFFPGQADGSEAPTEAAVHQASDSLSASMVHISPDPEMPDFEGRNLDALNGDLFSIHQNQIRTVLSRLPKTHAESVSNIILDYNKNAYRGLGGNEMVVLRAVDISSQEMMSVLIHEMGHNVDYAFLKPEKREHRSEFKDGKHPIYETDPSLNFFRISWQDENTLKKTAVNMDFVSGYAMTNPFEDFAETYIYYVLHNKDFKVMASSSDALYQKYIFMKYTVFDGVEFDTGAGQVNTKNRPWDATLLTYDIAELIGA